MIKYDNLKKSLEHLKSQNDFYKEEKLKPPHRYTDSVKESLIQRFEICFDCLWKTLKHHFEIKERVPKTFNSPKKVFKEAIKYGLPSPLEKWDNYTDARNATSHDYDGNKAQETINVIDDFIRDAISMYEIMTEKKWKQ